MALGVLSVGWKRLGASLALLLGVASAATAQSKAPLEPVVLQLHWQHQFQFAGYYAAVEQGFYADAGLKVEIREANLEKTSTEQVISGEAQYGVANSNLVLDRGHGKPVVVLAPIFQHSPVVMLARQDLGVDSVHDLAGKPIIIEPGSVELFAYLEQEGVSRNQLVLRPHEFDPEVLIRGEVVAMSAYSTDEPFVLKERGIPYSTFTPRASGIDFYGDTLFTSEQEIAQHPDRVKRFLHASLRGWEYAVAHPKELVDVIYAKYSHGHSMAHLQFEAEMSLPLIAADVVEVGYVNPGRFQHIAKLYERMGLLPKGTSLDGLCYRRDEVPDLRWLYGSLAGTLAALLVIGGIALYLHGLYRAIHRQAAELRIALAEIRTLQGIIPICSYCKKIRDDQGSWSQLETYIAAHSEATFSHGICNECVATYFAEYDRKRPEKNR